MPWGRAVVLAILSGRGSRGRVRTDSFIAIGRPFRPNIRHDGVNGCNAALMLPGCFMATSYWHVWSDPYTSGRAPRTRRNVSLTRWNVYPRTRRERAPPLNIAHSSSRPAGSLCRKERTTSPFSGYSRAEVGGRSMRDKVKNGGPCNASEAGLRRDEESKLPV
jgi:hypothetical protein